MPRPPEVIAAYERALTLTNANHLRQSTNQLPHATEIRRAIEQFLHLIGIHEDILAAHIVTRPIQGQRSYGELADEWLQANKLDKRWYEIACRRFEIIRIEQDREKR